MNSFIEKISWLSVKLGNQIHLKSIRDAFATILPFIMLAGFMVLINSVVLNPAGFMSHLFEADTLRQWQQFGASVVTGTLGAMTLLVGAVVAYTLSQHRDFDNPLATVILTVALIIIFIPPIVMATPTGGGEAIAVSGMIPTQLTGPSGMFVGIVTALLSTEVFIRLSRNERMKIHITGEMVPPAVIRSFNTLIPSMLTVLIFSFFSFLIHQLFNLDLYSLIGSLIQKPLTWLVSSSAGFIFLMAVSQLFYSVGIAGSGILGPIMDPVLLVNMQENMAAFAAHSEVPHIINTTFRDVFGIIGGGGNTIALILAIFIASKRKDYRDIASLSAAPGIFNINEPVVFGLPIVYNITLMVPFIFTTPFCLFLAYLATRLHLISEVVVMVPWTTPVIISGFLATGGDWRAALFQVFLIVICTLIYLPFVKANNVHGNDHLSHDER